LGLWLTKSQTLGLADPVARSLITAVVRVPMSALAHALVSAVARAPALAGHSCSGLEGYWALPG
jgi:hypothetical protein